MTTYGTDSQGKFIPASQRPDGTWRKPRRVRDGYVPQEEVPLYESKGKQFAQKPALPPGLSPEVVQKAKEKREREKLRQQREEQRKILGHSATTESQKPNTAAAVGGGNKASNAGGRSKKTPELPDIMLDERPAKGKQQQQQHGSSKQSQQKKESSNPPSASATTVEELTNTLATGVQLSPQSAATEGTVDGQQQELVKKLRKLRKKIREIEAIEERLRTSEGPRPDKDQLEKVKRKPDILREIEELEVQSATGAM